MRVSADDRREQLIDATIEIMKRVGVQSLTVRAVAQEAGATLAAVHYCFRGKEEMIHAAIERWLANMLSYAQHVPTSDGLRAAVVSFARSYWDELEMVPHDVLAQIELVIWSARQERAQDFGGLIYPGYEKGLGAIFERTLSDSHENSSITSEDLTRAVLVIIDGCSLQYISQPERAGHREMFEFLIESLVDRIAIVPDHQVVA
jgi:AcrR family transcriptional regulator